MNLESFKKFLLNTELPLRNNVITVRPFLSREYDGKYWYIQGVCVITANFLNELVIEWYKGKSEEEITINREEKAIIDFVHLNLDEILSQKNIHDLEINFIPAKEIVWNSWIFN